MYQGAVDFFKDVSSQNAAAYGLLVVGAVASASLALHSLYTLLFRVARRLTRHS